MAKRIVFFLGAGASKPLGIPLTGELLPLILKSIRERDLFWPIAGGDHAEPVLRQMEQELENFIYMLVPGLRDLFVQWYQLQGKKQLAIDEKEKLNKLSFPLITEILSIVDHLGVNNNTPFPISGGNSLKELSYYRRLLDRAIFEILADDEYGNQAGERNLRDGFINYLASLMEQAEETHISIITTNYDTTIDLEIFKRIKSEADIDFGFSWRVVENNEKIRTQPQQTKLGFYKLHGSLNWLKCDLCDHVYINPSGNIIHQAFRTKIDYENTCHCNHSPLKSIIVAPSFERDVRDANLLHVWKSALQALRQADKWVMIGYSLPPEDLAIKSLLIRARNSRLPLLVKKDVDIVQWKEYDKPKYNLFFGENNFTYYADGLEGYLNTKGVI